LGHAQFLVGGFFPSNFFVLLLYLAFEFGVFLEAGVWGFQLPSMAQKSVIQLEVDYLIKQPMTYRQNNIGTGF